MKVAKGCYTVKFDMRDSQWFHNFFWVHPNNELPNINNWNTTFFLEPRPNE